MKIIKKEKKLIRDLDTFTINDLSAIALCIKRKMDDEYVREPEAKYGSMHNSWENKWKDLDEIANKLNGCKMENDFIEVISLIRLFQEYYGGLSRLKVYENTKL